MLLDEHKKGRNVAVPAIRRLPFYLNALESFRLNGQESVSTTAISSLTGVSDSVVKKDLNMLGAPGKTGVGYAVLPLLQGIERFLGWDNPLPAVLVGVGGLGTALLGSNDIRCRIIDIVAAFDIDPALFGDRVNGVQVHDAESLTEIVRDLHPIVAVLTVPDHAAQKIVDRLVSAGVTKIWSFSTIRLDVPRGVLVQREILASGLAELLAGTVPSPGNVRNYTGRGANAKL